MLTKILNFVARFKKTERLRCETVAQSKHRTAAVYRKSNRFVSVINHNLPGMIYPHYGLHRFK